MQAKPFKNTALIIILVMFYGLYACDKKDDLSLDKNLLGSWIWDETRSGYGSVNSEPDYVETPLTNGCGQILEFRSNGEFYWSYTGGEDCSEGDELSRWSADGQTLTFIDGSESNSGTYTLTLDTLTITMEYSDDGENYWEIERWHKSSVDLLTRK
jgi:hypothetical protein